MIGNEEARALLSEQGSKLTEYEKACQLMQTMMQGPNGDKGVVDDEVKRTVYVGNLSRLCTPQDLRNEFSPIGEVVYIKFSQGNSFVKQLFFLESAFMGCVQNSCSNKNLPECCGLGLRNV